MPVTVDHGRVPGALVYALAMHVTSEAECARRFGSRRKTKLLPGRVIDVEVDRSGARANCFLTIDFNLDEERVKRKRLNLRSVERCDPSQASTPVSALNQSLPQQQDHPNLPPREEDDVAYSDHPVPPSSAPTQGNGPIDAHGTIWEHPKDGEDEQPVGGRVPQRDFGIRCVTGEVLCADCDYSARSPIDYFLMMFPPRQLTAMVRMTNRELLKLGLSTTGAGEMLKFIGVLMLCTRYEFGERRYLWSKESPFKYMPAPNFGKTGISRSRFDSLFRCVRFSDQPDVRGSESSEQHRWRLVDDFADRYNQHRLQNVIPSELICVDESISRWYGQGGDWINHGLPMYVAIDRKPGNGCEIQNAACGLSGIMLRLRLVRTAKEETRRNGDEGEVPHGAVILKELVHPWSQSDRIVCADSYFASVPAANELRKMGLRFIGVVKTATRHFPMASLSEIEMSTRGESRSLVNKKDGRVELMATVWMDRDRRYFISSAGSRAPGTPYVRMRWRQICSEPDALPERVELCVPQPVVAELYYTACAQIDRHNRCRQADLALERKVGTLDWSMRVNISLVGMCIVDAWLAYKICKGRRCAMTQKQFYNELCAELTDNNYDAVGSRVRQDVAKTSPAIVNGVPRSGIDIHLTPTKRRRVHKGEKTKNLQQGKCKVCRMKTTRECSQCRDSEDVVFICDTKKGKNCFAVHLNLKHDI